jgi:hypothetical protein
MRYLPKRPPLTDFFKRLESATLKLLSSAVILESLAGNLSMPSNLRYVPEDFTYEDRLPLICSDKTKPTYLSHKYSAEDSLELSCIGVRSLSTEEFLADLRDFILEKPQDFQNMPNSWHSHLSKVLVKLINDDIVKSAISRLEIIPLRNGQWVSALQESICLSNPSDSLIIPNGLKFYEISPITRHHESRRILFVLLGVKSFSKDLVCDAIIKAHEDPQFYPESRERHDLISHIVFLYKANWRNTHNHDVWLATESGPPQHGSNVYLDSVESYSAKNSFIDNRNTFAFLHEDYSQAFVPDDGDWKTWFMANLNVEQYPRLVFPSVGPEFTLSKDFQVLLDTCPPVQVLLLLRDHWSHYSKWIIHDENLAADASKVKLTEKLSSMRVICRGGGEARLDQTVIPLKDIDHENITSTLLLDIPEPEDPRWRYLHHFDVTAESGPNSFIQNLRQLKASETSLKGVSELYRQIQNHSNGHSKIIR